MQCPVRPDLRLLQLRKFSSRLLRLRKSLMPSLKCCSMVLTTKQALSRRLVSTAVMIVLRWLSPACLEWAVQTETAHIWIFIIRMQAILQLLMLISQLLSAMRQRTYRSFLSIRMRKPAIPDVLRTRSMLTAMYQLPRSVSSVV